MPVNVVCALPHIRDQSGKEWVAYTCGQCLHEDCTEDCVLDDDGNEQLCHFCLDILY